MLGGPAIAEMAGPDFQGGIVGDKSSIQWLQGGATWNPIRAELLEDIVDKATGKVVVPKGKIGWFCIKCSPGCAGCYACGMNLWRGNGLEYAVPNLAKVRMFLDEKTLAQPLKWKRPRLIFPCSMTDWMEPSLVPDEWIDKMLAVMALTPQHTYLSLTKRADRQRDYITQAVKRWSQPNPLDHPNAFHGIACELTDSPCAAALIEDCEFPLKNLWLGVSAENQKYADERIPLLLQTPASLRWVSAEPLLGSINIEELPSASGIGRYLNSLSNAGVDPGALIATKLDWIVAGGESGPKARPMHPDWARSIRDQCVEAGVPFFFKQWGCWLPGQNDIIPDDWKKSPNDNQRVAHWQDGKWGLRKPDDPANNYAIWRPDGSLHNGYQTEETRSEVAAFAIRVNKKDAGRMLDGREWNEFPPLTT